MVNENPHEAPRRREVGEQKANYQVRPSDNAFARLLVSSQTWFNATSPSEHQYLRKESEDRLPMVLTTSGKTPASVL